VQWNLEGGSITDLSSNSSSIYYNFDSFEQIQVVTGGGDVSVQSSGLAINLVTKSGSNVFKATFNGTYENDAMLSQNVTKALFDSGAGGFLSGNPLSKIAVYSIEAGGPIVKDRLWYVNRTTSVSSRSLTNSYQTERPTWEVKSDGTYFVTHKLGGEHSLKFGLGWRKAPIVTEPVERRLQHDRRRALLERRERRHARSGQRIDWHSHGEQQPVRSGDRTFESCRQHRRPKRRDCQDL
jgi:hypothetical protein